MEVEDALSAKFRTLIEGLMVTTTAEIVKMFSKVLLETRVEISRSWKEIDSLKQQLEECELEKTEAIFRAQRLSDFKREDDEVEVSRMVPQPDRQTTSTARSQAGCSVERAEIISVGDRDASLGNTKDIGTEAAQPSNTDHQVKKGCMAKSIPCHNMETHGTQTAEQPKLVCPAKVKGVTLSLDKTMSQSTSNTPANGPSSSVGTLTVNLQSKEIKAVVKKRKLIKKNKHANNIISVARALRDRPHRGMQRRCLCCPSDECFLQLNATRAQHQVPTVYICRKCEKRFKTHILFKSHKCSMPQSCSRCGQIFSMVQGLTEHVREVSPLSKPRFSCSHCDQTFTNQCAWNLHERMHTNVACMQNVNENTDASSSHASGAHKDIKAKLEVRLERISDSQLEAALCTKNLLQDNPHESSKPAQDLSTISGPVCDSVAESVLVNVPKTREAQESLLSLSQNATESLDLGPGTLADSSDTKANVRKVYAVMSTSSCHIQISEDADSLQPQSHATDTVMDEGQHASNEAGVCSSAKKQKMSECSHDAYNGVFPVEKILKWRINKGRKEVRVKWVPCSMCGAKFQNTWEPAENFPGYLNEQIEEPKEKENDKK